MMDFNKNNTKNLFFYKVLLIFKRLILIIISLSFLFPLYYMFLTSFKHKDEFISNLWGLPKDPTFENFKLAMFDAGVGNMFINTIILTIVSVLISTFLSSLAAYAFAKMEFFGKRLMMIIIIALMGIPAIIMIIPLFVFMSRIGITNTYLAPIIIYIGLMIPFSVYLLSSFFKNISDEIIDASKIDGCSNFKTFIKIIIPLSLPVLTTVFIVNALWVWNELLIALIFLNDQSMRPLMVGIVNLQEGFEIDVPLLMASLLISILPMIILYIFSQKIFIKGFTEGALKE